MLEKKWLNWSENELKEMQTVLQELEMYTELISADENTPLPVLSVGLQAFEDAGLFANITLSPFEKETFEYTKLMHIGVEFIDEISEEDVDDVRIFITELNNYLPIGHFNLLGSSLAMKTVTPISKDMKCANAATLEAFSVFTLLAMQLNGEFMKYAKGEIELDDVRKILLP